MLAFRKLFTVLAVVALFAVTASAQQAFTCSTNAGVPPLIRAEALADLVGDVVLNCTGGIGAPGTVITTNVQIFMDTNITSKLVDADGKISEATLLINEPGTLGGPTPTMNLNIFQGLKASDNSVTWLGVPVPIAAPGSTTVIRITNVRANANMRGVSTSLIPTALTMFISMSGSQSIAINNPQQTVGFIQPGLKVDGDDTSYQQCKSQSGDYYDGKSGATLDLGKTLKYKEGFATAFKALGTNTQTVPGTVYNTETGLAVASIPALVGSVTGTPGIATQGTRLIAKFSNVPAGIKLYVGNISKGATALIGAVLISGADSNGAGGSVPAPLPASALTEVTLTGGSGTATWEIYGASAVVVETMEFDWAIAYKANPQSNIPGLGTANVNMALAPLSTVGGPSITAPVPRFADTSSARKMFDINACVTNLLFPFVTNQAGFDTGIAISNTSLDIFKTKSETGNCTLNYFGATAGGGAAPAAQTTTTALKGGDQAVFTLSSGGTNGIAATPGFQGYMIAQCAFRYAHGFAFVSDVGARNLAMGYLALVMDNKSSSLNRGGQTGEYLAQ